ncbi:MAG: transposase [Ktedonobacterales bacterium]
MILRVFQAQLKSGKRGAYERHCRAHALPLMRAQPGCLSALIGASRPDQRDQFVVVSVWRDLQSLQAFAGEQWRQSLILPGEADLLERASVAHYEDSYASLVQLWHAHAAGMKRREVTALTAHLTDRQWAAVQPWLPLPQRRGRPRADDRRTLDGILYVLRNGCRWRDLPATYGDPVTCWRRFIRWEADGAWERIWSALLGAMEPTERCAWALAFLDSRSIPTQPGHRRRTRMMTPYRDIA